MRHPIRDDPPYVDHDEFGCIVYTPEYLEWTFRQPITKEDMRDLEVRLQPYGEHAALAELIESLCALQGATRFNYLKAIAKFERRFESPSQRHLLTY